MGNDFVTSTRTTACTKCGKQVKSYFYTERICESCVVGDSGAFPCGLGCYMPCSLCKEPNIYWYKEETYGDIAEDCGNHDDLSGLFGDVIDGVQEMFGDSSD